MPVRSSAVLFWGRQKDERFFGKTGGFADSAAGAKRWIGERRFGSCSGRSTTRHGLSYRFSFRFDFVPAGLEKCFPGASRWCLRSIQTSIRQDAMRLKAVPDFRMGGARSLRPNCDVRSCVAFGKPFEENVSGAANGKNAAERPNAGIRFPVFSK